MSSRLSRSATVVMSSNHATPVVDHGIQTGGFLGAGPTRKTARTRFVQVLSKKSVARGHLRRLISVTTGRASTTRSHAASCSSRATEEASPSRLLPY